MNLTIASMIKDEMGRFLPKILGIWNDFSDNIIILDDSSSDGSREECKSAGAMVVDAPNKQHPAWGEEYPKRKVLFDTAWGETCEGSYILFLDADMIPARNPRMLMDGGSDAIKFSLYDLWNPRQFRSDTFWQGHNYPRIWMIKRTPEEGPWEWNERGIHCGHIPQNLPFHSMMSAPRDFSLLHYAYVSEKLRRYKHMQYMSVKNQLDEFEFDHADSILDEYPTLEDLPFECEWSLV